MTYDTAVESALAVALTGDQLYQDALDQWAEAASWYEPAAYLRTEGSRRGVEEVSGYVGDSLLMVLAEIAERRASR